MIEVEDVPSPAACAQAVQHSAPHVIRGARGQHAIVHVALHGDAPLPGVQDRAQGRLFAHAEHGRAASEALTAYATAALSRQPSHARR